MPEPQINFFSEDVTLNLKNKTIIRAWLIKSASAERRKIDSLNYIFCSDRYLKKINSRYLKHNYFTDIITFPTSDPDDKNISGDIFISIDRVKENAATYGVRTYEELHRVLIHGLLHLCGYDDGSESEQKKIRAMENQYLEKISL